MKGQDMTNELARVDDWASVLGPVAKLAQTVANTSFVPKSFRGDTASITAALLMGRELGLQPMASLQHIHVIEGRPTLSAQIMRAMVISAGHTIEVVENTSESCVLKGKRQGEKAWTEAKFTIQEANKANLSRKDNWQAYAKDMLFARATSRLCRMVFPDAIGGISYTPEDLVEEEVAENVRPTIVRAKKIEPKQIITAPEPVEAEAAETFGPPLSFEDEPVEVEPVEVEAADEELLLPEMVTDAQLRKLLVEFGRLGLTSRQERLAACSEAIGRELKSSKEMTKAEASRVIEDCASRLAGDFDV
jgi:hypothetical protein